MLFMSNRTRNILFISVIGLGTQTSKMQHVLWRSAPSCSGALDLAGSVVVLPRTTTKMHGTYKVHMRWD
jgi:hypothetical protein